MPTRTVKARVELDGEKEYRQALNNLNSGNKVLASEMRKLQAEYKGNTESVEYLTKRGDVLDRQLQQQKDKVETLRQAVANAAQQYGESSEKTQAWIVKLNDAEAAQMELEHAVDENNTQLENQGNVMNTLTGKVEEIAGSLGIQIPDGAKKALDGMKGMSNGAAAALGVTAAAVTALIKAVKQLHQLTLEAASQADDLITRSMQSGVNTDTLQQWEYASNLIDVSTETMTDSLTKLTRNMASARDGNAETMQAFADLGVSVTDSSGQLRDAEDVFYDVIEALGQIPNETERDAAAMAVLGKNAQELNPLIIQGADALKGFAAEAEATGYVLDESQIAKLGEVDDSYQRMQLTIEATKKQMAADFAPASKAAMDTFSAAIKAGADMLQKSGIIKAIAGIVESLSNIIRAATGLTETTIPAMGSKMTWLQSTLNGVAQLLAAIADFANLVTSIVTLDWNGVKNSLGFGYKNGNANNVQRVTMQQNGTLAQYDNFYGGWQQNYGYDSNTGRYYDKSSGNYVQYDPRYNYNASGNDNWRGGLTWVGEAGPELVSLPGGTQILNAQDSRNLGGDTFYVTIDAKNVKEFNDIVELAQSARVRRRMEG